MDVVDPLTQVRETCASVAAQAAHVTIDPQAVRSVAAGIGERELRTITTAGFDSALHFFDGGPLTAQYLLVIDTLNFCFWPEGGLEYEHLARGLKECLEADEHALDSKRLAIIDGPGVQALLRRPNPLPFQDERARLLREVGRGLLDGFGGHAAHMVHAAGRSAARLVTLMTAALPGFRDHCIYRGRQVFLYKRAQIFAGDLWGAFGGVGLGAFDDVDRLTMFADYRVPVVLRQMGILAYSADLALKVDTRKELPSGSEQEIEIRACTVMAVEHLRDALAARYGALAAPDGRNAAPVPAPSTGRGAVSAGSDVAAGQPLDVANAVARKVDSAQTRATEMAAAAPQPQSVADGVTRSIEKAGAAVAGLLMQTPDSAAETAPSAASAASLGRRSTSGRLKLPNSVQLDWCLWETGEAQRNSDLQHHRTRTIYY